MKRSKPPGCRTITSLMQSMPRFLRWLDELEPDGRSDERIGAVRQS